MKLVKLPHMVHHHRHHHGSDCCQPELGDPASFADEGVEQLLSNNRLWSEEMVAHDPNFFLNLKDHQNPVYFWIGCADSRVPVNSIMGMHPGDVFVQRNVGNQASQRDLNCMSCLEYAVTGLGVRHVLVCGHYNCGAIKAALTMPNDKPGLVNFWISDIRAVRDANMEQLMALEDEGARLNRLSELNVMQQVLNVCSSSIVAAAWARAQPVTVHGLLYHVDDGRLQTLCPPMTSLEDLECFTKSQERYHVLSEKVKTAATFQKLNMPVPMP